MSAKPDDLEAVRNLVSTLEPFPVEDRERIIRWAREKLGMAGGGGLVAASVAPSAPSAHVGGTGQTPSAAPTSVRPADIKAFVGAKSPKSDVHFATTVAYYYEFEAPEAQRKAWITKDDLIAACRLADRKRPVSPAQVLVNAYHEGFLDRGERGQYKLNSVGENLVAMVLPGVTESLPGVTESARNAKMKKAKATRPTKTRRAPKKR